MGLKHFKKPDNIIHYNLKKSTAEKKRVILKDIHDFLGFLS